MLMENKYKEILKFSNPEEVYRKAKIIFGNSVIVGLSTRKKKKYMLSYGGRVYHFGEMGYEDYTFHQDEMRREKFRNRNARFIKSGTLTPGVLAYYLLW